MFRSVIFILFLHFVFTSFVNAQSTSPTFAEKLGYPKASKVLILHVDDAGMSYDSNEGAIAAITNGAANSCSVMMPCPWVPGFVSFLKDHPDIDAGLHLTLTSEWRDYKWSPLAGNSNVPGLTDSSGYLWPGVGAVVQHASPGEVEQEIRAQIKMARSMGFDPTHLDSHMGTVFASTAFLERYIKVGIEEDIPVMIPGGHARNIQKEMNLPEETMNQLHTIGNVLWTAGLPVIDDLHNTTYDWTIPDSLKMNDKSIQKFRTKQYIEALHSLEPGITMLIMHCTQPSPIFKQISDSGEKRKGDLLVMQDPQFLKALKEQGIILTTWREMKERRDKVK